MNDSLSGKVSRRRFLKHSGGLVIASGLSSSVGARISSGDEWDAIVVGGGFAGITAARDLQQAGARTIILEARNRIGGRTFTHVLGDKKVELGGAWVHWTQPHVWSEIQRYGLPLSETPGASPEELVVVVDGRAKTFGFAEIAEEFVYSLDAYFAESREVWERPWDSRHSWESILARDSLSAADQLRKLDVSPVMHSVLTALLETQGGNYIDRVSYAEMLRWYALSGSTTSGLFDATGRYTLANGITELLDYMHRAGGAELALGKVVTSLKEKGGRVRVSLASGEILEAPVVVFTVPLNVIHDIDFDPPLPAAVTSASRERHAGQSCKFYARVGQNLGNIMTMAPGRHGVNITFSYSSDTNGNTVLVGFGPDANRLDPNDEESVEAGIGAALPGVTVEECLGYDWNSDPFSSGVWSSFRPGGIGQYLTALQSDHGRILMASSDTCEGWRGFIDGAIGSGSAAAQRALRILQS